MLKFALCILFSLFLFCANAQTHHFVFIEGINKQPFSILLNGKKYESKGKNFITIPQLVNGNYQLLISTEDNKSNIFSITIENSDLGFSLKKNTNNDLALFDINRFVTIEQDKPQEIVVQPIEKKVEAKPENPKPVIKDSVAVAKPVVSIAKANPKSVVKKISSKTTDAGIEEVYIDSSGKKVDTIIVAIPLNAAKPISTPKEAKAQPEKEQVVKNNNIDVIAPRKNDCPRTASERDIANFSAQIQAALTLKNKLKVANSVLGEKCYTTNQIKRMGGLFLNESGKFNFYKLSQPHIADLNNFPSLEQDLKDEILKKEFMALINTQ